MGAIPTSLVWLWVEPNILHLNLDITQPYEGLFCFSQRIIPSFFENKDKNRFQNKTDSKFNWSCQKQKRVGSPERNRKEGKTTIKGVKEVAKVDDKKEKFRSLKTKTNWK